MNCECLPPQVDPWHEWLLKETPTVYKSQRELDTRTEQFHLCLLLCQDIVASSHQLFHLGPMGWVCASLYLQRSRPCKRHLIFICISGMGSHGEGSSFPASQRVTSNLLLKEMAFSSSPSYQASPLSCILNPLTHLLPLGKTWSSLEIFGN